MVFVTFALLLIFGATTHGQTQESKPTRNIGRAGCNPGVATRLAKEATTDGPEYGDLSEIADCRTVYVEVNDLDLRKKIIEELSKDSRLIVVGNDEDADFFVAYGARSFYRGATVTPNAALGPQVTNTETLVGELIVTERGRIDDQDRRHTRYVWTHKSSVNYYNGTKGLGKNPAVAATREFLKELSKARGKK
jgi:hypothetical protein